MIREGWIDSDRVDALDVHSERFFIRLCLKADDYGRFHASPQLLKSLLFPMKDDIRNTDMTRCLNKCEESGLIRCYEVAGKRYLEIENFGQRLRAKVSKYPPMDDTRQPLADTCQTDDGHMSDTRRLEEKRSRREEEENTPLPPKGEWEGKSENQILINPTEADMLPSNARRMKAIDQKRTRCVGNTPTMSRINEWFGRRPSTLWTVAELLALVAINPSEAEVGGMEAFYLAEDPTDELFRRRDLLTLLNNWQGELDKARGYARRQRGSA